MKGKQRSYLKSLANQLDATVNIGKGGLTESVLKQIDQDLEANELVKIKVLNNNMDDKDEMLEEILEKLDCEFVSQLGFRFVVYRRNEEKPKIELPD